MTEERSPPRPAAAAALQLAAVRVALVPVILAGARLVDSPTQGSEAFPALLAAFAAWAVALVLLQVAVRAGRARVPPALERLEPFVDLAAIAGLTYTSGGPFSETGMAFFVLPLLPAGRLHPGLTARWGAAAVAAFVALSLLHPTAGRHEATARMFSQVGYLAWAGLAAWLLSSVLARRDAAIAHLAQERGELAAQALAAEQRERRRLAELLHDGSVQTLALAQQELADFRRTGRDDAVERARDAIRGSLQQLRGEIAELHPYVLEHAGLRAALSSLAEHCAARMGVPATVVVDPAARGAHDELLTVLARELLCNAAKHSRAAHVVLSVAAEDDRVVLEVRDDGVGFDPARREAALREGHIGLASSERRAQAAGGAVAIASARGRGTTVRVTLPRAGQG